MKFDSNPRSMESSIDVLRKQLRRSAILLCGSLLLGSVQTAQAARDDRPSLREFREMNNDLSRKDARKLFHDTFGRAGHSVGGASLPTIPSGPKPGGVSNLVQFNNENRRAEKNLKGAGEAKLFRNSIQDLGSRTVRLSSGVDLDLSSADRNIVLGGGLFKTTGSVDITVGSETQTYSAGSKVTAAEYVAIKQALSGDGQKIVIDGVGTATGGSVDLTAITADSDPMRASSLTIASGVTTYGDFGRKSDFSLKGDLNNFGSLYASAAQKGTRCGSITAQDITNNEGALISSAIDLELNARGNLSNYGEITSSGDLTLTAGNVVDNKGSVSATNSVNLNASTVNNSSSIESLSGDVNIAGTATAALTVNNASGTMSALNGAINVRTPDYSGTFDNNVSGGNLLSRELNLHSGLATNYVNVDELTGVVSQTGLAGHVIADTNNLVIGETCLTGDPTFFNTAGDISISSSVSVAEALTIVATGNILSANGISIEARSASSGFDISFIAGATITNPVSGGNTTIPPLPAGTAVTLDGAASTNGGIIQLGTDNVINSSPTPGGTGAGGNVKFYAFKGGLPSSGRVNIGDTTIITGGVGAAANGNVEIVAGGDSNVGGATILIGGIDTSGGTGGGGSLTVVTAQPESSGGAINYNANGTLAAGGQLVAGATITSGANIRFVGDSSATVLATVGGDATIRSGGIVDQTFNAMLNMNDRNADVVLFANGSIGINSIDPFLITGFTGKIKKDDDPGSGTLDVTAVTGSANILSFATTRTNLLASSADDDFFFRTAGALNVVGDVDAATGLVRLENTGGDLDIFDGVHIGARTSLQITNGSKKAQLILGQNTLIETDAVAGGGLVGNITITRDKKALDEPFFTGVQFAGAGRQPPTYSGNDKVLQFSGGWTVSQSGAGLATLLNNQPTELAGGNMIEANDSDATINVAKKGGVVVEGAVHIDAGQ